MAGAAADARDKADDRLAADLRRIGRGQVICNDDARLGNQVDRIVRNALEVFEHALGNIADIGGARLHIFIIHRAEHRLEVLAVDKARILRADHFVRDQIGHAFHKIRIIQHQQMGVENLRLRRADVLFRLFAQGFDLLLRLFHRIQHTLLLRSNVGDGIFHDGQVGFLDHKCPGMRQALGNADRFEFKHFYLLPLVVVSLQISLLFLL